MSDFTKTKIHFALALIGTLFALHPLVEKYPDIGFSYLGYSLKLIYAYALVGGLLALTVYCYGLTLLTERPSSWGERIGNFAYAVAILTPPLYGSLFGASLLAKQLDVAHLEWAVPTGLILLWLVFSQLIARMLRKQDHKVSEEQLVQQEIGALARAREMFNHHHYDVSVIEAWKALEARLRRVLLKRGITGVGDNPQQLIEAARHAGLIREPALGLLQELRRQWNIAVSVEPLSREAAETALQTARDILATIPLEEPGKVARHKV